MWLLIGGFFVCGYTVALVSTHFVAFATDRGMAPTTTATALGLLPKSTVCAIWERR
jgi:hypothetical protein